MPKIDTHVLVGVCLFVSVPSSAQRLTSAYSVLASELTAAAVILQFWTQKLQPWHWAIIIIVPVFALQLIHVRVYGMVHVPCLFADIDDFVVQANLNIGLR